MSNYINRIGKKSLSAKLAILAVATMCLGLAPMSVDAKNKNNDNQIAQITANNFTVTTQNLSSQISSYVANGQLSQAQANNFNAELAQLSSQAMMTVNNPDAAQQSVAMFGNFTNRLNASLSANGTYNGTGYAYNPATPYNNGGWGNGFRGRWSQSKAEWQARMAQERAARDAARAQGRYTSGNRWGY